MISCIAHSTALKFDAVNAFLTHVMPHIFYEVVGYGIKLNTFVAMVLYCAKYLVAQTGIAFGVSTS